MDSSMFDIHKHRVISMDNMKTTYKFNLVWKYNHFNIITDFRHKQLEQLNQVTLKSVITKHDKS